MQITTMGFAGGVYVLPLAEKDVIEMVFIMYFLYYQILIYQLNSKKGP